MARQRSCKPATRPKTPPMQTRERSRQKLEMAQQGIGRSGGAAWDGLERRPVVRQRICVSRGSASRDCKPGCNLSSEHDGRGDQSGTCVKEVRQAEDSQQRPASGLGGQRCQWPAGTQPQTPDTSLEPAVSSRGSPSTVPRAQSEAASSPDLPSTGLQEPLELEGARVASSPPKSQTCGALLEIQMNSASPRRRRRRSGQKSPALRAPGIENVCGNTPGMSPESVECSPQGESSLCVSISWNMSPLARAERPALPGRTLQPELSASPSPRRTSGELPALTCTGATPPLRSKADPSLAWSGGRKGHRGLRDSRCLRTGGRVLSDAFSQAEEPASEPAQKQEKSKGGVGEAASTKGPGRGGGKVAQMKSLWEERLSTSGAGSVTSDTSKPRGRQPGKTKSAAWLRCASDVVRKLRHMEVDTCRVTDRLMCKLGQITGEQEISTPPSALKDISSLDGDSWGDLQPEDLDSPTAEIHRGLLKDICSRLRVQRQLSRAAIRVLSLDSIFKQSDGVTLSQAAAALAGVPGKSSPAPEALALPIPRWQGWEKELKELKELEWSRRLTGASDVPEPALEPQPQDSPREAAGLPGLQPRGSMPTSSLRSSLPDPDAEPQPQDVSSTGERSITATEGLEEFECTSPRDMRSEWNETADDSSSSAVSFAATKDFAGHPAGHQNSGNASLSADVPAVDTPRACEDGMQRWKTLLHQIEQDELSKQVLVWVPEGLGPSRLVQFDHEGQKLDVVLPEGFEVGQQVPILVPKQPPLERSQSHAYWRGHYNHRDGGIVAWPDKCSILELLRHGWRAAENPEELTLEHPEFRSRYNNYALLRGRRMCPLLPYMPEEDDEFATA